MGLGLRFWSRGLDVMADVMGEVWEGGVEWEFCLFTLVC